MRIRLKSFLFLFVLGISAMSYGQSITVGGTIISADEDAIRLGSHTLVLTLTGDTWVAGIGIGGLDDVELLNSISCVPASADWTTLISSSTVSLPVGGVVTIDIPIMPGFNIDADIILSIDAPASLFTTGGPYSASDFTTIAQIPPTISVDGTITGADEGDIRIASHTITLTLTEDDWAAGIGLGGLDDVELLNSISCVPASADWTTLISSSTVSVPAGGVVTIDIPIMPGFNIDADIILSIDAPASLFTTGGPYSASDFTTIAQIPPALTADGTITGADEGDIRLGSHTITLTLTEDDWAAGVGTGGTDDDDLLASITSNPVSSDWDALIASSIVSPPAAGIVTITIPLMSDFDITSNTDLSVDAPASLFVASSSILSDANFVTIDRIYPWVSITSRIEPLREGDLDGDTITVKLHEVEWENVLLEEQYFTINSSLAGNPGLRITHDNNVDYEGNDSATIKLGFNGASFSTDQTFSITIDEHELEGTESFTSNSITVVAVIEPVITSVSIANSPMGIDAIVPVTIIVDEDVAGGFTLDHGTIAGRSLTGFTHVSGDTYTANFTITEGSTPEYFAGQNIPVDTIMLMNGSTEGVEFSTTIIAGNDPIDATRPVVDLINFNNGTYLVGDELSAVIHATESGLSFNSTLTTINGVPLSASNVTSNESGAGIYQLNYTIEDGEDDVLSGPVLVEVVMLDVAGNQNTPAYSTVTGTDPIIDATLPGFTSVSVTSTGVHIPGDIITIAIQTTELVSLGAGSHVNSVSDIGSGPGQIRLVSTGGTNYNLEYRVGPDDNEVDISTELFSRIVLVDARGNEATQVNGLGVHDVTIVTEKPVATIAGGGSLCPGDSVELFVSIAGEAPFELLITDGVEAPFIHIASSGSYSFYAKPLAQGTYEYTITRVEDDLGVLGTSSGIATVVMNDNPSITIDETRTTFQENSEPFDLVPIGDPPGGSFSGTGVVSSESMFYASIAGIANSPHTIYYDYENPLSGCSAQDSVIFTIVVAQANIDVPDIICYNDPATEITATVLDPKYDSESLKLYQLLGRNEIERPEGIEILGGGYPENYITANILPDKLGAGTYSVVYEYSLTTFIIFPVFSTKVSYYSIRETFVLDEIPDVKFRNPTEDEILAGFKVCKDQEVFQLETTLDDPDELYSYVLRNGGDGITGSEATGYFYNPALTDFSGDSIDYLFTSENGCSRERSFYITNLEVPDVDFRPQAICIPINGGEITFSNLTTSPELVDEWRWEFGDVNSGENNTDTVYAKTNPIHDFTSPGPRLVSLEIETVDGCIVENDTLVTFGDKPLADFRWVSDCYVEGAGVSFVNESFSERNWLSFKWKFTELTGDPYTDSLQTSTRVNVSNEFPRRDNFNVMLVAENDLECTDTLRKVLKLKETNKLGDMNYFESFNVGDGNWSTDQDSLSIMSNWTYAEPKFDRFESTPGDLGWFTKLTPLDDREDDKDYDERSWIQSPCFDLRDTERPMIRMDIMGSFDGSRDGAVLQYTLNDGVDWVTIGNISEGINWYNSFDIKEKPGGGEGSNIGWSGGDSFDPDTSWLSAAHDLDVLIGEETVIFGIFYATDGASVVENQGFAVDNIYIGERSKRALIEHFTNSADLAADDADEEIDDFTNDHSLDVTSLQYHLHYPGDDPMNENNSAPASSRSFYYGISGIPYALMDGGVKPSYQYDFQSSTPTANQLKELTLESPYMELNVKFQLHNQRLSTLVGIKALQDIDSSDIVLYVAVVEKEVTLYTGANGDSEFNNVVLAMLPSPAGTLYSQAWTANEEDSQHFSWTYGVVEDYDELMLVAFVQDRESGKVLQVASEDVSEFGLGSLTNIYKSLKVYPNPANNQLNVEFDEAKYGDVVLELTDMTGRTVMAYELYPGEQYIQLDIEQLREGAYILQSKEKGRVSSRTNFIKLR